MSFGGLHFEILYQVNFAANFFMSDDFFNGQHSGIALTILYHFNPQTCFNIVF